MFPMSLRLVPPEADLGETKDRWLDQMIDALRDCGIEASDPNIFVLCALYGRDPAEQKSLIMEAQQYEIVTVACATALIVLFNLKSK